MRIEKKATRGIQETTARKIVCIKGDETFPYLEPSTFIGFIRTGP